MPNCLHPGEVVFYEIVGYEDSGKPIMGAVNPDIIQDKHVKKEVVDRYGENIVYNYGCPVGQHDVYVYRIAYSTPVGNKLSGVVVSLV